MHEVSARNEGQRGALDLRSGAGRIYQHDDKRDQAHEREKRAHDIDHGLKRDV